MQALCTIHVLTKHDTTRTNVRSQHENKHCSELQLMPNLQYPLAEHKESTHSAWELHVHLILDFDVALVVHFYYCFLDGYSGYYQIEIAIED